MKRTSLVSSVAVVLALAFVSSHVKADPHHQHGQPFQLGFQGHASPARGFAPNGPYHNRHFHYGHSLPRTVYHNRYYVNRFSYPSHLRHGYFYTPGNYFPPYYYGIGVYGGFYPYYGTSLYVAPAPIVIQQPIIQQPPAQQPNVQQPPAQQPVQPNNLRRDAAGAGVVNLNKPAELRLVRPANDEARARALRYLANGDRQFQEQDYQEALRRYKTAAQAAGDLADAYFRQGFAEVALGKSDDAIVSFKRGLALDPAWAVSGFRLEQLYGNNGQAKTQHIDMLAAAAFDNPQDSDRLFLVAVYLYFDGKAPRSERFFRRASQLAHDDDSHVQGFLRVIGQVAQQPAGQEL